MFRYTIITSLSLISTVFLAGSVLADCPEGDLNRDCKADFLDFAVLADSWLEVEPNLPTDTVIISEVMAHSSDANGGDLPDWIELYNTAGSPINIGGWYLSDSDRDLTSDVNAYKIPNGITIPAYGYIVFYENEDPNFGEKFKLSESGDDVYLSINRGGPFGMDDRTFDASDRNVSFGRYITSTGDDKFVAMNSNTPGATNSYPKVGPVVINEIMYYYDTIYPDNDNYEYIELYNIEDHDVNLWTPDPCGPGDVSWAITKGVEYVFPNHTTIPDHNYLIIAKYPTLCRSAFSIPAEVPVLGPFSGKLSNEGEDVQLSMPGELDAADPNIRHYIRIDNVNYSDGVHHENFPGLDPWFDTRSANGNGESLHRTNPNLFGDDAGNWFSESADPGE
jgi:hypothetical protein